ncbi:hypothetical protein ElyMa_005509900 [Elysia marginata]|uniref:Uncharacterized protein n=1 Tax=Elysia marginata TaxID=1093978 RepID=A0AAV4EV88_9GAST|nr:hypothetical protein ElyMa_005509900 [Elysia marginata]
MMMMLMAMMMMLMAMMMIVVVLSTSGDQTPRRPTSTQRVTAEAEELIKTSRAHFESTTVTEISSIVMRTFLVCLLVVAIIGLVLADDKDKKKGVKGVLNNIWKKTKTAAKWLGDNTVSGHTVKFSANLVKGAIDKIKDAVKGKKKVVADVEDTDPKGVSGF